MQMDFHRTLPPLLVYCVVFAILGLICSYQFNIYLEAHLTDSCLIHLVLLNSDCTLQFVLQQYMLVKYVLALKIDFLFLNQFSTVVNDISWTWTWNMNGHGHTSQFLKKMVSWVPQKITRLAWSLVSSIYELKVIFIE